jgi:hypothetical protein
MEQFQSKFSGCWNFFTNPTFGAAVSNFGDNHFNILLSINKSSPQRHIRRSRRYPLQGQPFDGGALIPFGGASE